MTKSPTAIAIISIWLVTIVALASICKIAGFPLPIINRIHDLEWIELVVKFFAMFLD